MAENPNVPFKGREVWQQMFFSSPFRGLRLSCCVGALVAVLGFVATRTVASYGDRGVTLQESSNETVSVSYDRVRDITEVVLGIKVEDNGSARTRLGFATEFVGLVPPATLKSVEMWLQRAYPRSWDLGESRLEGWTSIAFLLDDKVRFAIKPSEPSTHELAPTICIDTMTIRLPIASLRQIAAAAKIEISPMIEKPLSDNHVRLIREFLAKATRTPAR